MKLNDNCESLLLSAMYSCSDGELLLPTARCNGYVECSDAADEQNCCELCTTSQSVPTAVSKIRSDS